MPAVLDRGTVVLVALGAGAGHEQRGTRPCIVVSDPEVTHDQRFPMVCVIPLTATPGEGALYPQFSPGESGLRKRSYGLIDQIRSIDKRRVIRAYGALPTSELQALDEGLRLFLGMALGHTSYPTRQ